MEEGGGGGKRRRMRKEKEDEKKINGLTKTKKKQIFLQIPVIFCPPRFRWSLRNAQILYSCCGEGDTHHSL